MDQQTNSHPALIYFGSKTLTRNFPLILFVGREPQTDQMASKGIGTYDFTKYPRCAFWNTAYSQLAQADGHGDYRGAALKRDCLQAESSPIAFADALPICLSDKNSSGEKRRERSAISRAAIDDHIDGILSFDLLNRVDLVVLSGHERQEFSYATGALQTRLDAKGIRHISTAFLYPTNSRRIQEQLIASGAISRFQSILGTFRNAI